MQNRKTIIALLLVLTLVFLAAGCGQAPEAPKDEPGSGRGGINPWVESSEEECARYVNRLFKVPEGAGNAVWRIMSKGEKLDPDNIPYPGPMVQLNFDLDGESFTARAQTGEEEDISGMYYEWEDFVTESLEKWGFGNMTGKYFRSVSKDDPAQMITWYDVEIGTNYSLSVPSFEITQDRMREIVNAMYDAEKEPFKGSKEGVFSNRLFSLVMPEELDGTYDLEVSDDDIPAVSVFDKAARADWGGYVFGVCAYEDPADWSWLPNGGKVGELKASDGTIYDIVVEYPSDVQYDLASGGETYQALAAAADSIIKGLVPADGCSFLYGGGMKGDDLYGEILAQLVTSCNEMWEADELEISDMSMMYAQLGGTPEARLQNTGFFYRDVNGDGVDELLVGEITDGDWKGIIYDMWTMEDRAPAHVMSGWARNRFYALDTGYAILNEYSSGASDSGVIIYTLTPGTAELTPLVFFRYDAYTNKEEPWSVSYDAEDETQGESITEEEWNESIAAYGDIMRFDYIPLASLSE